MPKADIPPREFVQDLRDPGIWWPPLNDFVKISQYLCAVKGYGGNDKALQLKQAIATIVRGTPDEATINRIGPQEWGMVFTGQGKPDNFAAVISILCDYADQFKAYKDASGKAIFAEYYKKDKPIQAMVDDKMLGLDCIGFVGRYLEEAKIWPSYRGMYPRQYLSFFSPIRDIGDMEPVSVLVWINGSHIAVIDAIQYIADWASPQYAVVDICQSSSGGPQLNKGVRLQITSSTWLDFGAYGRAVDGKTLSEDQLKEQRQKYTSEQASSRGYAGGEMFSVQLGDPAPPVRGTVYVGKMKDMSWKWFPSAQG
jgi:hypothetical protein